MPKPREVHVERPYEGERETRQPSRVLLGHCPECGEVVLVENEYETWPLVFCRCGWAGATDEVANRVRFERDAVVVKDDRQPELGETSGCLYCARTCERCGCEIPAGGWEHVEQPQAEGSNVVVCNLKRVVRPLVEILDVYLTHARDHGPGPKTVDVPVDPEKL